jgi:voltage-gated potassium channel
MAWRTTYSGRRVRWAVGSSQPFGGVVLIGLLMMLRRFVRALGDAWRSDEAFRALLALVVSLLVSGTVFFVLVEGWSVLDAFYFSVTTLTTVGFGDPAPATAAGKLFTVLYILVGLGVIGGFINVLAKHTLARQRRRAGGGEGQEDAPPSQGNQDD